MEASFEKEVFRRAAISWVRKQAPLLTETEDYRFLEAAAWLFAIGSEIRVRRPDVEDWDLKPADSLAILAGRLRRLRRDLSWLDLYRELCEALLTVEMALDPKRDGVALDQPIGLAPTLEGCSYPFGGRIHFWLHPPSALAAERLRRYEEAGEAADEDSSRPPAPRWRIQDHLLRLSVHWERKASPRLVRPASMGDRARPLIERSGADAVREGFRIALCPLPGGSHPLFKVDDRGRYFRAQGISDLEELNRSLEAVIQAAEDQKVHLVVLPELMVPPAARDTLVQRLSRRTLSRPYGVLAGSFHIPAGSNQTGEGPLFNEACLLDHRGRRVLCHQKQFGFRLRRREALPPFFPGGPPKSGLPAEIYEDIEDGSELAILDTTLGRLAILICFDALAADPDHGFEELIRRVRPDLLFVLSMSTKTRPFEEVFKRMAEHWIGTAYVNAHCVCRPAKGLPDRSPLLACCDLALQEPDGVAPTRVLWRIGQDTAQCLYYGDGPHPERTGAEVHPTLGLILDIGVHLGAPQPRREREQKDSLDILAPKR